MNELLGPFKKNKCEYYVFNDIVFRRYPDGKHHSQRKYFICSGVFRAKGIGSLHREIYKAHFGEIPNGFVIHHKDENTLNNSIDNLECIQDAQHRSHHGADNARKFWGNRRYKVIKCEWCEQDFRVTANQSRAKACSMWCYTRLMHIVKCRLKKNPKKADKSPV